MAGYLTTHVLDIAHGKPAANLGIELWRLEGEERTLIRKALTNAGGRTDGPLLSEGEFEPGSYELVFMVGDYFKSLGFSTAEPPFLDHVPVRFGISDEEAHHHVPLLVSPWAYSTYRGS